MPSWGPDLVNKLISVTVLWSNTTTIVITRTYLVFVQSSAEKNVSANGSTSRYFVQNVGNE